MAAKAERRPKTMPSPETGETLTRGERPFDVTYKGNSVTVSLPGYYPQHDGESVHVGDDLVVVDEALRDLKEEIDGIPSPRTIRELRSKLGLSQRAAGLLFRVGSNAFDKYERGVIEPSGPTIQLMKILDQQPRLLGILNVGTTKSRAKIVRRRKPATDRPAARSRKRA